MSPEQPEELGRIELARARPFRLGALTVTPALRQVARGNASETLEPRVMQVLVALADAKGGIVTREMLLDRCWAGVVVGENAVNRVLSRLRQLSSGLGAGCFEIETITKVGYRLLHEEAAAAATAASAGSHRWVGRRTAIGALGAAGLAGAGYLWSSAAASERRRSAQALYQAGLDIERRGGASDTSQAIVYFQRAAQADPDFADAWGALAWANLKQTLGWRTGGEVEAITTRVSVAAERALRLDPSNPDALAARVLVRPPYRNWSLVEAAAMPLSATTVNDATGDFLGTFGGTQNGYLDIVSASATFDGTNFTLGATLNGPLGTPGSLYVFGINRGAGTARLSLGSPPVGAGVLFDAVAVLFPDGTGRIASFPAMGAPTVTTLPGAVTVNGNSISGLFPLTLLPSTGFVPAAYTFALWSRQRVNPAQDGTNAEIADFAPNAAGFVASGVPEPGTWLMLIAGFGLLGAATRRAGRAPPRQPMMT